MPSGTIGEVFVTFLRLGLTSFGGPLAHIGYFREALVVQRRWVSEQVFGELLSLTQFLPGPASSQLGFALGLLRAGWGGAVAAFAAFTLPSALLLLLFARLEPSLTSIAGRAALHGLKLVAVCVVAQALFNMARQLTPDAKRMCIALLSAASMLLMNSGWAQWIALLGGATAGILVCKLPATTARVPLSGNRILAAALLATFLLGLLLAMVDTPYRLFEAITGFYRAGALVFGGGHVVLPLLERAVVEPGLVSQQEFLAGYGAAQAIPGPMFSFAIYLGAKLGGYGAAFACLLAIFLPGFLLLGAALPFWSRLIAAPRARNAVAGVNASVVGLLAAAFWTPVCREALTQPSDVLIAALGALLLLRFKVSTLWVVLGCVVASVMRSTWAA